MAARGGEKGPLDSHGCRQVLHLHIVLLMEEILHQLGCKYPANICKYWDRNSYLSTGAGFLSSTVCHMIGVSNN